MMERHQANRPPRATTPLEFGTAQTVSSPPLKKKRKLNSPNYKKGKDFINKTSTTTTTKMTTPTPTPTTTNTKQQQQRLRSDSEGTFAVSDTVVTATAATNAAPSTTTFRLKKSSGSGTATAEGQMMAHLLSTFSQREQQRFEAFQRSSVNATAVEALVAARIAYRRGSSRHTRDHPTPTPTTAHAPPPPHLHELVSTPSVAQEITAVVATLAKIYAQRLVASAVQVQRHHHHRNRRRTRHANHYETTTDLFEEEEEEEKEEESFSVGWVGPTTHDTNKNRSTSMIEERPLEPEYLQIAFQQRVLNGLDPGFYFQPPKDGIMCSTTTTSTTNHSTATKNMNDTSFMNESVLRQQHVAALAVQDKYFTAMNHHYHQNINNNNNH